AVCHALRPLRQRCILSLDGLATGSHTMGVGRSRLACTASADALLTGWAMMVALSRTRASYTTLSTYPVPPTACDRPPACRTRRDRSAAPCLLAWSLRLRRRGTNRSGSHRKRRRHAVQGAAPTPHSPYALHLRGGRHQCGAYPPAGRHSILRRPWRTPGP